VRAITSMTYRSCFAETKSHGRVQIQVPEPCYLHHLRARRSARSSAFDRELRQRIPPQVEERSRSSLRGQTRAEGIRVTKVAGSGHPTSRLSSPTPLGGGAGDARAPPPSPPQQGDCARAHR